MKQPSPHVSTIWKATIVVLAALINVALAARLFTGEKSVFAWKDMKEREAELSREIQLVDAQRADLSRQIRLLQTDSGYVENVVRQRLNYVRKNEVLYLFNDQKAGDEAWEGQTSGGSKQ